MSENNHEKLINGAVIRVGIVLLVIITVFFLVRQTFIPKSFGEYGYYRGDNVGEWAAMEVNYAPGNVSCSECHQKILTWMAGQKHRALDCQACHGPALKHAKASKPEEIKVQSTGDVCGACHNRIAGRPGKGVAAVDANDHSGGVECVRCHDAHRLWAKKGGTGI